MLWKLFQFVVVIGVVMANVSLQFTPNGMVAGLVGLVIAGMLTKLLTVIFRALESRPAEVPIRPAAAPRLSGPSETDSRRLGPRA